ncbi:MAG: DUF1983 domain-containing protein [Gammaproteobacteria bacterium]|nr:DUF1983 domain-containing protein [Gammaproteobacteria bacterium]
MANITVKLHGDLQDFGNEFNFNVNNSAEAIRALITQVDGLQAHIVNGSYHLRIAEKQVTTDTLLDDVKHQLKDGDVIEIIPVVAGSSKAVKVIGGAVLAGIGFFTANPYLVSMGVGMALGGVAELLSPTPTMDAPKEQEQSKSSAFNSISNTQAEGSCVPVVYGKRMIGSKVISQSVESRPLNSEKGNLESAQTLKIIDLLCEGEIEQELSLKNLYLDNTPVQNEDGTLNFKGVEFTATTGTAEQDILKGFNSFDKITSVGAKLEQGVAVKRTIINPHVSKIRITIALNSLYQVDDKGNYNPTNVNLTVVIGNQTYPINITGKAVGAYHHDLEIDDLPSAPFDISVIRDTADSDDQKLQNKTVFSSYVETVEHDYNYPHAVLVGLKIDSAQFGGKVPKRSYLAKWRKVQVPNNYDTEIRSYNGIWNGEFKTAWTNNPAWIFYDLVTNDRYGLGERLQGYACDKWSLYQIAKHCDVLVPNDKGEQAPRFTCNVNINNARSAKSVLDNLASVFRGLAVWDGVQVTTMQDSKKDPVAIYTNSNVVDGEFTYNGTARKTIFTAVHVEFDDEKNSYRKTVEYVEDKEAINRYGLNVKRIKAFGCTNRSQAIRLAKWLIETSINERQMISFSVAREGIKHLPFDIIQVADNDYAGDILASRVVEVNGNVITAETELTDITAIKYHADNEIKTVNVQSVNGKQITLTSEPVGIKQYGIFSVVKSSVQPRLFRAIGIKEDDGVYTISAVTHDNTKEAKVDNGVSVVADSNYTMHAPTIQVAEVVKDDNAMLINVAGVNVEQYIITIYRNGTLYKKYTTTQPQIKIENLPNGKYKAEIRGKSISGQITEVASKEWLIDYNIQALMAHGEMFAIKLNWTCPVNVLSKSVINIYHNTSDNQATAKQIASLTYPINTFTLNGAKIGEIHYFWLRLVDENNNAGKWISVSGECSSDTSAIVDSLNGKLTKTALAQSLIDSLQNDIDTSIEGAKDDLTGLISDVDRDLANSKKQIADTLKNTKQQVDATREQITNVQHELDNELLEVKQELQNVDENSVKNTEFNELESTVNSNKSSINTLSTTVANNNSAIANKVTSLEAKAMLSNNMILDSEMEVLNSYTADTGVTLNKNLTGWRLIGGNTLYLRDVRTSGNYRQIYSDYIKVEPNQRYQLSAYAGSHRCKSYLFIYWYDKDKRVVGNSPVKTFASRSGGRQLSGYDRKVSFGNAPSNAVYARAIFRKDRHTSGGDSYLFITKPFFGLATATQTEPSPYQPTSLKEEQVNAKIETESTARANADSALSNKIETVKTKAQANSSAITTEQTTRANADTALGRRIDRIQSTSNSNTAKISSLSTTVANNNSAIANKVTSLEAKAMLSNNMILDSEMEVLNSYTADTGVTLNKNLTGWRLIGGNTLYLRDVRTSGNYRQIYSDYIKVEPNQRYQLSAYAGSHRCKSYLFIYWYDKDKRVIGNSPVKTFASRHGGRELSGYDRQVSFGNAPSNAVYARAIFRKDRHTSGSDSYLFITKPFFGLATATQTEPSPYQSSISNAKAQSTYTIKTQAIAGNKKAIAGIALGAMANETTAESSVIVMANKFGVVKNASDGTVKPLFTVVGNQTAINGDLIASGSILGKHIKANQTLSAPIINGGSLNINNKFIVDRYGNLTAKSGTFEGIVKADKIQGQIDVSSLKKSAWIGGWNVYINNEQRYALNEFNRSYPTKIPSLGGIIFDFGGNDYDFGAVLFEMQVVAKSAVTVRQKIAVVDDYVDIYINNAKIGTYGTGRIDKAINYTLKKGVNTISIVAKNTEWGVLSLSLLGDFVDNDNIKFR